MTPQDNQEVLKRRVDLAPDQGLFTFANKESLIKALGELGNEQLLMIGYVDKEGIIQRYPEFNKEIAAAEAEARAEMAEEVKKESYYSNDEGVRVVDFEDVEDILTRLNEKGEK